MAPDLAVVVVSHQSEDDLADCLESVLARRGGADVRVVVSDAGSTDATEAVARRYPVTFLPGPNEGFARANNRALSHPAVAEADYVLFLNPDARVVEGTLGELVAACRARPDRHLFAARQVDAAGAVVPTLYRFPTPGAYWAEAIPIGPLRGRGQKLLDLDLYEHERECDWAMGSALVVSRTALDALGGFDERYFLYSEEVDLCRRAAERGWRVTYLPLLTVQHPVPLYHSNPVRAHHLSRSRMLYARRWFGPHGVPLARAATVARRLRQAATPGLTPAERRGALVGALAALGLGVQPHPPGGHASPGPVLALAQRLVLRTGRGPLHPLWRALYGATTWTTALWLRLAARDVSVYVRGSAASGEVLPGVSDIDVIAVVPGRDRPGAAAAALSERQRRLAGAAPPVRRLVEHFFAVEEEELADAARATALGYGLDAPAGREPALYFAPRPATDGLGLRDARPGLSGAAADWRLLAGPERRPPARALDPAERATRAWLELRFWWSHACQALRQPELMHVPSLCVKLVAEPARAWLSAEHGVRVERREEALVRTLELLPEEADDIRFALALLRKLHRSPAPDLGRALGALARMTIRVAGCLDRLAAGAGATEVGLLGGEALALRPGALETAQRLARDPAPRLLPLADWRACCLPALPDETFLLLPGDPADPRALSAAAGEGGAGPYGALRRAGLLALPLAGPVKWGVLRTIQCPATDPVSFALLEGETAARFPELPGWSVRDRARRAVAEHRAFLASGELGPDGHLLVSESGLGVPAGVLELGRLLAAARAALLFQTLEDGAPTLPLTVEATARLLADAGGRGGLAGLDALAAYREALVELAEPRPAAIAAFRRAVLELPAYAGLGAPGRRQAVP